MNRRSLPILANNNSETDQSDETYSAVSNHDFLSVVFKNISGEQQPVICSFLGHPGKVGSAKWFGKPCCLSGDIDLSPHWNNYFTLASFVPDDAGKYRRKKQNFAALHAIMLDDIGTKVAKLERLTLPPTWLIETSPDNFQAGYIFREPLTDGVLAVRIVKAIISAGLCDPGADGPLTRYARLPKAVNGKHEPCFQCRLTEFSPTRLYTVEEVINGLGIDFNPVESEMRSTSCRSSGQVADDEVYIPRVDENPVIVKLKEQNLYIRPLGEAKHEIICPWQHEHTSGNGGTAYFEPSESIPLGGFKCLHGHCANRHMRELREFLGLSKHEVMHRSLIRVIGGELALIVDCCERELAGAGRFYQRGGRIVSIRTDPGTRETSIVSLSMSSLARALSSIACFKKMDNRAKKWVDCDPPERYCRVLSDSTNYPHLPVLMGLSRQPYFRPDGTLMTKPAYDSVTGMFGLFDPRDYNIPEHPTHKDALNSLVQIESLLDEFSFKHDYDHAAAVAGILTAVSRSSIPLSPMFHVNAPQIASGKSYLTELITTFATATVPSGSTFPANDEECRKQLLAALLAASAVICFDNLTSDLNPYKSLCIALTAEFFTDRILGGSKTTTVGTRALFLSNGNNVGPIRDMARRTVTITLDPACETPATREFRKQPVAIVKAARGHYVSLALTIIRAWIVAGRPITSVTPLATYTEWSSLCRQPLLWLGRPDPASSIFAYMVQDPDRESLSQLLHAWHECFGKRPVMVREAVITDNIELREAIMDIASERGDINRKRLGKWISRHAGRIVDGLKFEKATGTRSAESWRVI